MQVPSTEVQNNFGKYLNIASEEEEVIVTRQGRPIVRMLSAMGEHISEEAEDYMTDGGKWTTYEEFLELTEKSDARYELIDGEVYCFASPSYCHQVVVGEILANFSNWFKGKKCRPLTSPFDIKLKKSDDNICQVQPDIVVICDTENVDEKGRYFGVPALAVEVLSGSTKKKDMIKKLNLFMLTGVKEYWLVDTDKKQIYAYSFDELNIKDYNVFINGGTVKSDAFPGLEVSLKDVFPE
jgi:prevent-host-death family protein